jgi:hypothetical protein
MIKGSTSGAGSVPLTSGSGSRRYKHWIFTSKRMASVSDRDVQPLLHRSGSTALQRYLQENKEHSECQLLLFLIHSRPKNIIRKKILSIVFHPCFQTVHSKDQGVTKRCRLSWPWPVANSAFVLGPKAWGGGKLRGLSQ